MIYSKLNLYFKYLENFDIMRVMSTELTVTIKGDESSYKQKFLVYDEMEWHEDDVVIRKCVEESLNNARIEPEKITVRGLLIMK